MEKAIATILLAVTVGQALALTGADCPPKDVIRPCICINNRLECKGFVFVTDLANVFKKVENYTFEEVQIESSVLQYIPHDLFENVTVGILRIIKCVFVDLFDAPLTAPSTLKQLYLIDTVIARKKWNYLASITGLNTLFIQGSVPIVLDKTFGSYLPKSLENLAINGTHITSIKPGALEELENLNILLITKAGLTKLTRDIFPTPFNASFLLLSGNGLTSIPDDLFTQMPKLETIDLSNNGLTTIPEQAFGGRVSQLGLLMLDGNYLNCDCRLEWVVKNKPELVSGVCQYPAELTGKMLVELTEDDFHCENVTEIVH